MRNIWRGEMKIFLWKMDEKFLKIIDDISVQLQLYAWKALPDVIPDFSQGGGYYQSPSGRHLGSEHFPMRVFLKRAFYQPQLKNPFMLRYGKGWKWVSSGYGMVV